MGNTSDGTMMAVSWRLFAGVQVSPLMRLGLAARRVLGLASDDGYGVYHDTHGATAVVEFHPFIPSWVDPYGFGEIGYGVYRFTTERDARDGFRDHGPLGGAGLGCLFWGRHVGVGPQATAQLGPENFAYLVELRLDFRP